MANYLTTDTDLTSVANAIRTKGETSAQLEFPADFVSAIAAIRTGGAFNVVAGTFEGTTADTAMDITLNYSGTGYPIAVFIFPSEGSDKYNGDFANLVQRYVYGLYTLIKSDTSITPDYSSSSGINMVHIYGRYKNSTTSAGTYSAATAGFYGLMDEPASDDAKEKVVKLRSKTKMSVYIAGDSYGFADNIEYTYCVLYSS